MTRLTHRNGAVVVVPEDKVSHLLHAGFTVVEEVAAKPRARRSTRSADISADE